MRAYPGGATYIKDRQAAVKTAAQNTLAGFVNQRRRWASKTFVSFNLNVIGVAVTVFVFNILILLTGLLGLADPLFLAVCVCMLIPKLLVDYLLLQEVNTFMYGKNILLIFLPAQIFTIIYFVVIGISAPIKSSSWKGRKISPSGKWA
jgi:cellulose synthase/poly-beta-1,6-N-acetylglucosamine synthase-like glycosyltransferase